MATRKTATAKGRTTSKEKRVVNPHTPVANEPEEGASLASVRAMSQGPSEGVSPHTKAADADGTEAIREPRPAQAEAGAAFKLPKGVDLRDIGEASFGPPPPITETVHGRDDRVKISNTKDYPWRVHASLLITARDNSQWIGTGWFIGPHTLVTAGHVVYIKNSNVPGRDGWVKKIQVMPGRDGDNLPYGSVTSTSFRSVTGWTNSGNENYDYGAIIIPTELGKTVGWFGFGVYPDADLNSAVLNISGYPGDKPSGTQWYDTRKTASVNATKVFYDIDTAGGQSGSAVYRIISNKRYGVAIHAYGGATSNSGTRISTSVYNNFLAWKG